MFHCLINFFQSEMKLQVEFTAELGDTSSSEFKSLATDVEGSLLPELKKTLGAIEAIQVTGFKQGSVIAEYNMIFTDPTAENLNASDVQTAVHTAVTTGNFTGLNVNTTYLPVVEGK